MSTFVSELELEVLPELGTGFAAYETEAAFEGGVVTFKEPSSWRSAYDAATKLIRKGMTDPLELTDQIFFSRHKDRKGGKLSPREPNYKKLKEEWRLVFNAVGNALRNEELRRAVSSSPARESEEFFGALANPARGGGWLEAPQAKTLQKVLLDFRDDVHLNPQRHRKLILTARLHPFPRISNIIAGYPVPNYKGGGLLALVMDAFGIGTDESKAAYDQILKETYSIANRKLSQEIEIESKNLISASQAMMDNMKRLKPLLLEAALLDLKELQTDPTTPVDLRDKFYQLGLRLVAEIDASYIIESDASEAHLIRLGWRFAQSANTLKTKDPTFKKLVDQERQKRKGLRSPSRKR
jgi:hypothetical protein